MLRAPLPVTQSMVVPTARDVFTQTSGNLTGKVLTSGQTWTAYVGDTDDFTVDTTGNTAQRATTSDTTFLGATASGRGITAGTGALTGVIAEVSFKWSVALGGSGVSGLMLRGFDATNYAACWLDAGGTNGMFCIRFRKRAGAVSGDVEPGDPGLLDVATFVASTFYTLRVLILSNGQYAVWFGQAGVYLGPPRSTGHDPMFQTGGLLASGMYGIVDGNQGSTACTRNYDNFSALVPTQDAVIFASRSLQLATDAAVREASGGTAYGPVSLVERDLPRLPPSGLEQRPVQMMFKPSRGDFEEAPDSGIDDVSVRGYYRRCWLFVPDESFNPLDLVTEGVTTVEMWLRPEALGAAGSSVATWFDSSGSGNNAAQSTGSLQPTVVANVLDGYRVVRSDGVDDRLDFTLPADATRTFYFVAKANSTPSNDKLFFGTTNACLNGNGTDVSWQTNQAGGSQAFGATVTDWNLYVVRVNSASSLDIAVNGGGTTNFDPNDVITTDTSFGLLNNTGVSEPWPGDLAEVLIANSALSSANDSRVRGYFSRKYPTLGSFGT